MLQWAGFRKERGKELRASYGGRRRRDGGGPGEKEGGRL